AKRLVLEIDRMRVWCRVFLPYRLGRVRDPVSAEAGDVRCARNDESHDVLRIRVEDGRRASSVVYERSSRARGDRVAAMQQLLPVTPQSPYGCRSTDQRHDQETRGEHDDREPGGGQQSAEEHGEGAADDEATPGLSGVFGVGANEIPETVAGHDRTAYVR